MKECSDLFEEEKKRPLNSADDYGKALKRMHDLIGKTAYDRFLYALLPNAIESGRATRVLKKVDKNLNAYDILEGLSYVTADMNRAMKELCSFIASDGDMSKAVMEKDYGTICSLYPELGQRLQKFLGRFGSKSDFNCYCFVARSWREEPDRFINTLRPMLKSKAEAVAGKEESEEHFREIMEKVRSTVSPKTYAKFEERVKGLRHYHYIREASQYLWESEFEYCRDLLRRLAGVLGSTYEDLLYLFADELYEVCEKGDLKDKETIIEARREKRDFAVAYWDKCMRDALAGSGDQVRGVGASNGQVKGKVCIVRSPEEFNKLEKNDILVCKYTDPEWTPLFTLAAGVVVDTGGTLSHAAIVAREYNIPAVLATGDATTKLKDGDMVLVNAGEGSVTVLG